MVRLEIVREECAELVRQRIANPYPANNGIVGSSPTSSAKGGMPEWTNGAVLKTAVAEICHRRFESSSHRKIKMVPTGINHLMVLWLLQLPKPLGRRQFLKLELLLPSYFQ